MTVSEFQSLWNGLTVSFPNCSDNQCMTLVHRYVSEVLKIKDISVLARPTAAQVWTEFAWGQYFTQVANTPNGVPPEGAIMVFKPTADNNNAGHISVVLAGANINTFNSFDADYPWGTKPHVQEHSYTDAAGNDIVYGWLLPNGNLVTQDAVSVADPAQIQTLSDAVTSCQTQLKEETAQNAVLQSDKTNLQTEISSLEGEIKDAKSQITILQTQLSGEQQEIINLNATIEKQAASNKDYATEIYTLSTSNNDLKDYLYATSDKLGIKRKGVKDADIEEAILTKLDDHDTLLKAAGINEGILHNMAQALKLDPNLSPQQIGDRIINYVKSVSGTLQNLGQNKTANIQTGKSLWQRFINYWWTA